MTMDTAERQRLIEQVRKELLAEIAEYRVGFAHLGDITATKTTDLEGQVFIIPDSKCDELFKDRELFNKG